MSMGIGNLLVILFIVLIVFGAGKIPRLMQDFGRGIKALRKELDNKDDQT